MTTNPGSITEYTFTGINGEVYKVSAPAGTSVTDAQAAFNKQLDSGSLQNLGIGQALGGLSDLASSALSAVKNLTNIPIPTSLDPASILKTAAATVAPAIGSLDPKQVTGLISQAGSLATQAGNIAGVPTSGIGQFNLSPQQLEQQGYLKPGTATQYCTGNVDYAKILSSPTLWTGKGGATDLSSFTSNPSLQTSTLTSVMSTSFDQLKNLGIVSATTSADQLGAMLQSAVTFGTSAIASWTQGIAPPELTSAISSIAKSGQQALSLVENLPSIAPSPEGAINTVDRASVNSAVNNFVGNPKVPPATYGPVEREKTGPDPNQPLVDKYQAAFEKYLAKIQEFQKRAQSLNTDLIDLEAGVITREKWDAVNATLQGIRTDYNTMLKSVRAEFTAAFDALPGDLKTTYQAQVNSIYRLQTIVFDFLVFLRERIKDDELLIGT